MGESKQREHEAAPSFTTVGAGVTRRRLHGGFRRPQTSTSRFSPVTPTQDAEVGANDQTTMNTAAARRGGALQVAGDSRVPDRPRGSRGWRSGPDLPASGRGGPARAPLRGPEPAMAAGVGGVALRRGGDEGRGTGSAMEVAGAAMLPRSPADEGRGPGSCSSQAPRDGDEGRRWRRSLMAWSDEGWGVASLGPQIRHWGRRIRRRRRPRDRRRRGQGRSWPWRWKGE